MGIMVTIKTIKHPNPDQAVDVIAQLVLKEILKQEQARQTR